MDTIKGILPTYEELIGMSVGRIAQVELDLRSIRPIDGKTIGHRAIVQGRVERAGFDRLGHTPSGTKPDPARFDEEEVLITLVIRTSVCSRAMPDATLPAPGEDHAV
jgi:hypothetical protein